MRKGIMACIVGGVLIQIAIGIVQADGLIPSGTTPLGKISACCFLDTNMTGTYESAAEFFRDSDKDGIWDKGEPFIDLNGNNVCDSDEYYYDINGNGKWDIAERFSDLDNDGQYDYADCLIQSWPFVLTGYSADGLWICIKGRTGTDGMVVFKDLPPSNTSGYTLKEDIDWSAVDIGWTTGPVKRATYKVEGICNPQGKVDIERWQATTSVERTFVLKPGENRIETFGNVCLARLDGVNEVYEDCMPGQGTPSSSEGWRVRLAGKDHNGRDVTLGNRQNMILNKKLIWYETTCGSDGKFSFVDMLPGRYYLDVPPKSNYRLAIDKPVSAGFDVFGQNWTVKLQNINKNAAWKVYSAYPGDSDGTEHFDLGWRGFEGDPITAVPGVLKIVPGTDWDNFKQSTQVCYKGFPKNTLLIKEHPVLGQCRDVFSSNTINQQGTSNVRLTWPLLYDPPNTTWTLSLLYGTKTPVQLPGETKPMYVHEDVWKWVVDTDIPHIKTLLDLFHELPFGTTGVPIISDENRLHNLKATLDSISAAQKDDEATAGILLGQFEMDVMDACITTFSGPSGSNGIGTGIAQTFENPACCKLLADAEYVGKKLGIYIQNK